MIFLSYILPGSLNGAPAPSIYINAVKRFAFTYKLYFPTIEHKLILVNSNGGYTKNIENIFEGIDYKIENYNGSGWDIGGHQHVVNTLDPNDWLMCFSTWTYFKCGGWLELFNSAKNKYGDAIYGAMSSHERYLHLRGTGLFMRCGVIQKYPYIANNKEQSWNFESGRISISKWYLKIGLEAFVVAPEVVVNLKNSRKLKNTYRSGDQSNLLVYDKHSDIYDSSAKLSRIKLELLANSFFINKILNLYLFIKLRM